MTPPTSDIVFVLFSLTGRDGPLSFQSTPNQRCGHDSPLPFLGPGSVISLLYCHHRLLSDYCISYDTRAQLPQF